MSEPLTPAETKLIGAWVMKGGAVVGDATCTRIRALTKTQLVFLSRSSDGSSRLYRDPNDGRLWEYTFPQSGQYGSGAPSLVVISAREASERYSYGP